MGVEPLTPQDGRSDAACTVRALFSVRMGLLVWAPIALIGIAHYATGPQYHELHDLLRRAYYLPIVFGAFLCGLRGGIAAALVVALSYLPHAFFPVAHHDPAGGIEKTLEIVLYHVVGGVAGYLADQEARRSRALALALEEQRKLHVQLVRAGRLSALGELVAGVAHELRNPIHSLRGTAEIVDPLVPPEAEERRMWELHKAELERLGRAADRFLSFARPSRLEMEALDFRDVATRMAELVGVEARKKNVTLELVLPDESVPVSGDRDALAQVGLNIAVNALQAIGERRGRIRVTVVPPREGSESVAVLRIENDGPPIPDDELEHVFDPFHSSSEEGTGLGLSISARIVDQHGGHIEAGNGGLGVVFSVILPA